MWTTILRMLPGLAMNAVGPVIDLIKGKQAAKLKEIKKICDHAEAGIISETDALNMIRGELI